MCPGCPVAQLRCLWCTGPGGFSTPAGATSTVFAGERYPLNLWAHDRDRAIFPAGQIDARYFEKPYYIVPRGPVSQELFAVIRDAMSRAGVIGLARVVLSSRERPFLVEPMGSGLRGVTLRFAHEVRGETDYFSDIPEMKLPADMMKLAQHIIRTKSGDFDPSMLEDHYRAALVRILRKKQAKRPAPPAAVKPSAENVVSLMDALRRSIAAEKRPVAPSTSRRNAAKPAARRARRT